VPAFPRLHPRPPRTTVRLLRHGRRHRLKAPPTNQAEERTEAGSFSQRLPSSRLSRRPPETVASAGSTTAGALAGRTRERKRRRPGARRAFEVREGASEATPNHWRNRFGYMHLTHIRPRQQLPAWHCDQRPGRPRPACRARRAPHPWRCTGACRNGVASRCRPANSTSSAVGCAPRTVAEKTARNRPAARRRQRAGQAEAATWSGLPSLLQPLSRSALSTGIASPAAFAAPVALSGSLRRCPLTKRSCMASPPPCRGAALPILSM